MSEIELVSLPFRKKSPEQIEYEKRLKREAERAKHRQEYHDRLNELKRREEAEKTKRLVRVAEMKAEREEAIKRAQEKGREIARQKVERTFAPRESEGKHAVETAVKVLRNVSENANRNIIKEGVPKQRPKPFVPSPPPWMQDFKAGTPYLLDLRNYGIPPAYRAENVKNPKGVEETLKTKPRKNPLDWLYE